MRGAQRSILEELCAQALAQGGGNAKCEGMETQNDEQTGALSRLTATLLN